jgi:hypothetical protein
MALYGYRNLLQSKELSPLLSLCRNLSRGSIISVYWSRRRLTSACFLATQARRADTVTAVAPRATGCGGRRSETLKGLTE